MPKKKTLNRELGVVLSDLHIPYQDNSVCNQALAFIRDNKPGKVHLLGDICDCYAVSRFVKDPKRKDDLQWELDETAKFIARVRDAAGDAQVVFSEGNHEFRLRRFLASEAKALAGLRSLHLSTLLGLSKLNVMYRDHDQPYRVGTLLYTHGQLVRKWSGSSAKGHFEKYGCCVIHGHTHRLGTFYHRDINTTFGAWENGCICDLNPDYCTAPDWQQGWSVVWTKRDYFHVEQIAVVKGRYCYHGKTYGRKRLSETSHPQVEQL
jgi:UDP-2,3-diacylglucosamine pyrophosphatase LpxH